MPAIVMCAQADCPMRSLCRRYTSQPLEHQSYFTAFPGPCVGGEWQCAFYIPLSTDSQRPGEEDCQ